MQDMTKVKEEIKKSVKKRTKEDCISDICKLLESATDPMTTKEIADKINLSHRSTKKHLQFLEFDGRVKHFARGVYERWLYWKAIRQ
jgi:response regulator of citrate/malate metabolism